MFIISIAKFLRGWYFNTSPVLPRLKSLVKSQTKSPDKSQMSNSDDEGPVGQESTSYKSTTIDT